MIEFPKEFVFGTSTAAAQIESAGGHEWVGLKAKDGSVFHNTTDHELLWKTDVEVIANLAPNYRMSLLWSRLQKCPYEPLNEQAVKFYLDLIDALRNRGVRIMLVLHHFENPIWFGALGGWSCAHAVKIWLNYVEQVVRTFGDRVTWWNTFNEPNLYLSLGYLSGQFPPFRRNPVLAFKVLRNISTAHRAAYLLIKEKFPNTMVGLSHNSVLFEPDTFLGVIPASLTDWWYMEFIPSWYDSCDFFGMSYYARIGYDPSPVTFLYTPEKFRNSKRRHDDMWEYHPPGIATIMKRYWDRFQKPLFITENGVATQDDGFRMQAIYDYLSEIKKAMNNGIPCLGYFHWTAWDNFEWNLGSSFKFGLIEVNRSTMERIPRKSAGYFSTIAHTGIVNDPPMNVPREV
ncbi:MAG: hypothetical protein RL161_1182 [Bacteroidota bacterium]